MPAGLSKAYDCWGSGHGALDWHISLDLPCGPWLAVYVGDVPWRPSVHPSDSQNRRCRRVSVCHSINAAEDVEGAKPTLYLELPCAHTHIDNSQHHRIVVLFILFISDEDAIFPEPESEPYRQPRPTFFWQDRTPPPSHPSGVRDFENSNTLRDASPA